MSCFSWLPGDGVNNWFSFADAKLGCQVGGSLEFGGWGGGCALKAQFGTQTAPSPLKVAASENSVFLAGRFSGRETCKTFVFWNDDHSVGWGMVSRGGGSNSWLLLLPGRERT